MTPDRLILISEQLDFILHSAYNALPDEVCGFLAGVGGCVHQVYPIRNVAPFPTQRFLMDDREQIDALIDITRRGWQVVAIYHSHPTGPPTPSCRDLVEATYPDALMAIIAPDDHARALRLRAYAVHGKGLLEIPVLVTGEAGQNLDAL